MILVTDCDGILTSSQLSYSAYGKMLKHFSVNDSLVVRLLKTKYAHLIEHIVVLTGDKEPGIFITQTRLDEIGLRMVQCCNIEKYSYIEQHFGFENTIYFGDDIYDIPTLKECAWSGTVNNAPTIVQQAARYVSPYKGGENGFTDLVLKMLQYCFSVDVSADIEKLVKEQK